MGKGTDYRLQEQDKEKKDLLKSYEKLAEAFRENGEKAREMGEGHDILIRFWEDAYKGIVGDIEKIRKEMGI